MAENTETKKPPTFDEFRQSLIDGGPSQFVGTNEEGDTTVGAIPTGTVVALTPGVDLSKFYDAKTGKLRISTVTPSSISKDNIAAVFSQPGNPVSGPSWMIVYKDGTASSMLPGYIERGDVGSIPGDNAVDYVSETGSVDHVEGPSRSSNFFGRLWGGIQDAVGPNTMEIAIPAASIATMAYSGALIIGGEVAGVGGAVAEGAAPELGTGLEEALSGVSLGEGSGSSLLESMPSWGSLTAEQQAELNGLNLSSVVGTTPADIEAISAISPELAADVSASIAEGGTPTIGNLNPSVMPGGGVPPGTPVSEVPPSTQDIYPPPDQDSPPGDNAPGGATPGGVTTPSTSNWWDALTPLISLVPALISKLTSGDEVPEVKPTDAELAQAQINAELWNYYQTYYRPLIKDYVARTTDTGIAEGETRQIAGQIRGEAMKGVTPTALSSNPVSSTKSLSNLARTEASMQVQGQGAARSRKLGEYQNIIDIGKGQATTAQAGLGELASQSVKAEISNMELSQMKDAAIDNAVGSVSGAIAAGLLRRSNPYRTFTVER